MNNNNTKLRKQLSNNWRKELCFSFIFCCVQPLSPVWLSVTAWTAAQQASLPSPFPRACSKSCPLSQWCHPTISSSVTPFSCLQSFPASGSFLISWFLASGGISSLYQSTRDSASRSVLPMNIQDWFPLGWTCLIFLQSKGLARVSNTTVQKHQFFSIQPSLWSALTSIHDYWKNNSFDYMDLHWQSNVSAF